MYIRMSVCNFVYSRDLGAQLWTIFDDDRHVQLLNMNSLPLYVKGAIVGVMFAPSIFEDRCVDFR